MNINNNDTLEFVKQQCTEIQLKSLPCTECACFNQETEQCAFYTLPCRWPVELERKSAIEPGSTAEPKHNLTATSTATTRPATIIFRDINTGKIYPSAWKAFYACCTTHKTCGDCILREISPADCFKELVERCWVADWAFFLAMHGIKMEVNINE